MTNKSDRPCATCVHAWRPRGYVEACALYLNDDPVLKFGKVVEATLNEFCAEYELAQPKAKQA